MKSFYLSNIRQSNENFLFDEKMFYLFFWKFFIRLKILLDSKVTIKKELEKDTTNLSD